MSFKLATAISLSCLFPAMGMAEGHVQTSHGISTFGELKYPADFTHFDYVRPDAPKGGTISFRGTGASLTFDSLNPFILDGERAQGWERIYDSLMVRAYDEPDAVYGLLAETVEYPDDRSWAIFTLREGATFADGEPVKVSDIIWTFETLQKDGSPIWRNAIQDVASVSEDGERRVRFDFNEDVPTRDLMSEVASIPILPEHFYQEREFNKSTLEPPLGSGPYVVEDADPGRSVTYCRNENYWADDLPVNIGTNNFDCYRYEYFADSTAAFEALKAGIYLFHEENFSAIWATGYDFPALENGWVQRDVIPDNRPSGAQGFWFNMRLPKFQDRRVREAIGLLFNFEWSNETLFYGLYGRTDSFWEGSGMQAAGLAEGEELAFLEEWRDRLPETVFTEPAFSPAASVPQKTDRTAVRRANRLLEEAGWTIDDAGVRRNAAGEVLSLEFLSDSPAFERIILPFVENLKIVGIDATLENIDPAQMQERQERFDYDMIVGRFVLPLSPSIELRTLFGSGSANDPGSFNFTGLSDPVVDEMIERIVEAEDRDTLETRVRALDRVLRDRLIWVPNWNKGEHWLAYWDVFGRPEEKPLYERGVDFWWWEEDKAEALREAGALR